MPRHLPHQPARGAFSVCDAAPLVVSPLRAGVSNAESRHNAEAAIPLRDRAGRSPRMGTDSFGCDQTLSPPNTERWLAESPPEFHTSFGKRVVGRDLRARRFGPTMLTERPEVVPYHTLPEISAKEEGFGPELSHKGGGQSLVTPCARRSASRFSMPEPHHGSGCRARYFTMKMVLRKGCGPGVRSKARPGSVSAPG